MPWTAADADQHKKGLSNKQRKKWATVANGALEAFISGGMAKADAESRAIKIANSRFASNGSDHPINPVIKPEEVARLKQVIAASLGSVDMEIFRVGKHNGREFVEADLKEIASNYQALKNELRPKLKITHRGDDGEEEEHTQESLAGLASYGDVTNVFLKAGADGKMRLFARVENVPKEVLAWIEARRFPERSIELYPTFKLGTDEASPTYKNVLKAIALLGSEMPAVPGMEPIRLEECLECQGTACFLQTVLEPVPSKVEVPASLVARMTAMDVEMRFNRERG